MSLIFLLFPLVAAANSCPKGYALARGSEFSVQVIDPQAKHGYRVCKIAGETLITATPLEIVGCHPDKADPGLLQVKVPTALEWRHPCVGEADKPLMVYAEEFTVQETLGDLKPIEDCDKKEIVALDETTTGSIRSIVTVIESDSAGVNGFKDIGQLDKYHSCLLSGKGNKRKQNNYEKKYRFMIEAATGAFTVPMALLTCSCGRESMFDANAESHTRVRGICQNIGDSLKDVNRWINIDGSQIQEQWRKYVDRLGNKIESPSCLNQTLTQDLVTRCPSLGIGAAAIYLKYLYQRAMGEESIGATSWGSRSVEALVALAAVNNVGPKHTNALKGKDENQWAGALLRSTCKDAGATKFGEVREHMLSIHSCLLADQWLDHQGKPLAGECAADNTPAGVERQLAIREEFDSHMPKNCN